MGTNEAATAFVQELRFECERHNMYGRAARFELTEDSNYSGIVRYKNLYCQYEIRHDDRLALTIGWHGDGFQLTAAPELEFSLEQQRWREEKDHTLIFNTTFDMVRFCLHELRNQSEIRHSLMNPASELAARQVS